MALKAAYNFDVLSGASSNQYADHSGNANLAQWSGLANTTKNYAGRRWYKKDYSDADYCLQGTGVGGRLATAYGPIITSGTTGFSCTFWFWYPTGTIAADINLFSIFIDSTQDQDRGGVYIFTDGKVGTFFTTSAGSINGTCNDRPNAGQWNHVAMIWNGATVKIWINGQERGETWNLGGTINWTTNHIDLGGVENWGGFAGERRIDDVRVYDHAITESQVLQDMLTPVGYTPPATPLLTQKSSNGRFYVDPSGGAMSEGNPLFLNARSAWGAFLDLPNTQWEGFIKGSAADGFNALYVSFIEGQTATKQGNLPFTDAFLTPNSAYWAEVDQFVQMCRNNGVIVLMHVMSAWEVNSWSVYTTASDANALTFGAWLQNRYPDNHVWFFAGGDWGLPHNETLQSRVSNLMDGSPNKTWFFHHTEETTGLEDPVLGPKADVAATYSYQPTYLITRAGYASGKPSFFIEGNYEFENNNHPAFLTTKETLRRQVGWTLTNGQMGTGNGAGYVWNVVQSGDTYRQRFLTTGVQQQNYVLRKFLATAWWKLVPDVTDTFITSGAGTKLTTAPNADVRSNDFATATIASDKSLAWMYVPTARDITIDRTKLGTGITVTRIDPTGTLADAQLFINMPNTGTHTIASSWFPTHSGATETEDQTTSDYYLKFTATPTTTTPTGKPRYIVRGGATVATTRYLVRGGSLVQITN